ncbi:hypothetical protein IT575_14260 [bacterium]|nr:hypothetical protein [bacterium]
MELHNGLSFIYHTLEGDLAGVDISREDQRYLGIDMDSGVAHYDMDLESNDEQWDQLHLKGEFLVADAQTVLDQIGSLEVIDGVFNEVRLSERSFDVRWTLSGFHNGKYFTETFSQPFRFERHDVLVS